MQDLKDYTQDVHYENFRKKKILQEGSPMWVPETIGYLEQKEGGCHEVLCEISVLVRESCPLEVKGPYIPLFLAFPHLQFLQCA